MGGSVVGILRGFLAYPKVVRGYAGNEAGAPAIWRSQ